MAFRNTSATATQAYDVRYGALGRLPRPSQVRVKMEEDEDEESCLNRQSSYASTQEVDMGLDVEEMKYFSIEQDLKHEIPWNVPRSSVEPRIEGHARRTDEISQLAPKGTDEPVPAAHGRRTDEIQDARINKRSDARPAPSKNDIKRPNDSKICYWCKHPYGTPKELAQHDALHSKESQSRYFLGQGGASTAMKNSYTETS
jgi:hypothetical protein